MTTITRKNTNAAKTRSAKTSTTSPKPVAARIIPTPIEYSVQKELRRYFDLLDGQPPADLYRLVIRQAENALLNEVMKECGGNQSKAATWLGISRGNLRKKLAELEYDQA